MKLTELIPSPVKAQDVPKVPTFTVKAEPGAAGDAGKRDRYAASEGSNLAALIYLPEGTEPQPIDLSVTDIDREESFHQTRKHQYKWAWTSGKEKTVDVNGRQIRQSKAKDPDGALVVVFTPEGADLDGVRIEFDV